MWDFFGGWREEAEEVARLRTLKSGITVKHVDIAQSRIMAHVDIP